MKRFERYCIIILFLTLLSGCASKKNGQEGLTPVSTVPDTVPPEVSISSPANNTAVSGISVTIMATASDNVGVWGVQFMIDGDILVTEDTESPFSTTWDTTSTVDGNHILTALAMDATGNKTVSTGIAVVVDNAPPFITDVVSTNITKNSATINWTTAEPATSQVEYGTTADYGNLTAFDSSLVSSHTILLPNLQPGTLYHCRLKSQDVAGNLTASEDFTFATLSEPVVPVDCEDPKGLLQTINTPPSSLPSPPTLVETTIDTETGITILTYQHVTDNWLDSPGFSGRTRKFRVDLPPGYDPIQNYPLMIWLHGGCGDFDDMAPINMPEALKMILLQPGDPNTDYENTYQDCEIEGKIPHYGYMSNAFPYIDPGTALERTSATVSTDALFVDYTQRRYRYYMDFVQSNFPADPNRFFVRGNSKGGGGAAYTTLFNQDRIAGGISIVPRPNINPQGATVSGVCNNYGYNMFDYSDIAWWIQHNPDRLNFWIETDHGKDDTSALFSWLNYPSGASPALSFLDTLEQNHVAHYTHWDEGGHGKNSGYPKSNARADPVLGYHWWDSGWDIMNDPTTYLRLDTSFPAFSHFSFNQDYGVGPSQQDCVNTIDPVYGTQICTGNIDVPGDNRHDGAIAGALNRHLRWNTNTIVDTQDTWFIEVKLLDDPGAVLLGGTCGTITPPATLTYPPCYDDYTGNGIERVDVTPRRLQNFKMTPGEIIEWLSSSGQSGTVTADADGVVTIPEFEVNTDWRTLTLRRHGTF